ncbi:HAD family hydrolase [Bacteroidota bacterium]
MSDNSKIELVVFDLDGTITMSHESIYKSTIRALKEFNLPTGFSEEEFYKMIGWHFQDIFDHFNIVVDDLEEFINVYKSFYFDFIDASKIYPGVEDLMKLLNEKKIKIALLTTKGQDQAEKIINHFELADHFNLIVGRRTGMEHKPSPEPLQFICKELNVKPENTLMIGDSEMDIRCAHNAGAVSCGVTFGYRTRELLIDENPVYLIDNFDEVKNIINHQF